MHSRTWKRFGSLLFALSLAIAGCQGEKGPQGDAGIPGDPGENGVSVGSITGTVQVTGGAGVPGAIAKTIPLDITSAATGANGQFTISNVPLGTYTIEISGPNIAAITIPNVVVVAQTATNVGAKVVTYSPMTIAVAATPNPAGFGKAVPLSATVTGNTGALTYTWSQVSGPTPAAFSDPASATPTFTTGTFEAMVAGGKLRNLTAPPARNGLLAITAQHVTNSTYSLKLEVSDGQYKQSKTFTVVPALVSAGQNAGATANVPTKVMVVGNAGTVDPAGWALTKPTASAAVLEAVNSKNPWFIPDVEGVYVLSNGAAVVSTLTASEWKGAPTAAACNVCHAAALDAVVEAKFKDWNNSAHGNHFFKYFVYDAAGNLVPKADAAATSIVVPTATDGVTWTLTAPFRPITTFEFAIIGGEGGHYSESCMRCHTVGMNKAVANGGIDDVTGYALPALGADSDPAFPEPLFTNFTDLPQAMRNRAGMQCESCHGPLNTHDGVANAPKAFFDAGTCAVCHDSGTNHDRYNLWSQSGHANLTLAEDEGPRDDCGRCHSAQGFVAWSKVGFDRNTLLAPADVPAAGDVEPQTCIACHDPHKTTLRVDESKPITTTSGFTVSGAGAGQLCVICHSSRRGLRNDTVTNTAYRLPHGAAQSDLFFGQNVFFFGALDDGSTMSTHAYVIKGTCVGCHLDGDLASEDVFAVNATTGARSTPRITNHRFTVSSEVCSKCHAGASLAGLKERTEGGVVELTTALAGAAARMLPATFKMTLTAPDVDTDNDPATAGVAFTGLATVTTKPDVVALGAVGQHSMALTFTWNSAFTVTFALADNATLLADETGTVAAGAAGFGLSATAVQTAAGAAVYPANSDFVKAYWNLGLIEEDQTLGAHNPGFTQQVLAVSKAKALAIPAAP